MEQHDAQVLAEQPWEQTLDLLTADMQASEIDIAVLADRYKEYINELQEFDLSVSARAIRICSALLNMKTLALTGEDPQEEEEPMEDPMAFEDEPMEAEEDQGPDLEEGPELDMPVKPRPRRRMELNELKDALRDAMEVKEKREERQEQREEIDQEFNVEDNLNDKINSLFSRLKGLVSSNDAVEFSRLLEEKSNEEKIEKFMHVLHLENDKKVICKQEEFLGDLHVKPEDEVPN